MQICVTCNFGVDGRVLGRGEMETDAPMSGVTQIKVKWRSHSNGSHSLAAQTGYTKCGTSSGRRLE